MNVKAFEIKFQNGTRYINPIFLKSLNGIVEEGDSIYKPSGAFKFQIFKKNSKQIITKEDKINCDSL